MNLHTFHIAILGGKNMDISVEKIKYKNVNQEIMTTNLYYVKFSSFEEVENKINNEFVDIVRADHTYELQPTKHEVKKFLDKKTEKQKYGAVAEFFAHVVLREMGYTQQCLYRNLEENSMKKGFDGLYLHNNSYWIMESKSSITSQLHKDKINEAIDCIGDSIEGRTTNNPWSNAVYHILALQNEKSDTTIIKKIKQLSKDYQENKMHNLTEFNLIPVSTLFVENKQSVEEIINDINNLFSKATYKDIIVVCLDNYVYNEFMHYLEN